MKWCSVAVVLGAGIALAQQPERSGQVLRIGVDLVQVDATVTDARGRHVPDLTAGDFEVLQDGRPQRVTAFSYVRVAPSVEPAAAGRVTGPLGPSAALKPDQVRRTIAIVVDDLGLSFESAYRAREVLRKFLDTQMQRGDLVAILRTGAGSGALQQFTSDRRVLDAAVERVRYNMLSRVAPFTAGGEAEQAFERSRNEIFTAGTLGAITYVIRGIGALPGRKSVIVLSDGFRLTDADDSPGRVFDAMRQLVDAANRAGVVVYTIDTRGLVVTGPTAEDRDAAAAEGRAEELRATQDGLHFLAQETGGLFLRDNNDLGAGVQRALDDQQGYYLLGYAPDSATFSTGTRPRYHRLSVRVKRPGLRVRSRRGFFGVPDRIAAPPTPANRMVAAVTSPFAGGDIRLRLSSFFGHDAKAGSVVLSVMHIDARDLTFTAQPDGTRSAELETLAVTFAEDGQVADQNSRRYKFSMPEEAHARALAQGLIYRIRVPLKRPGPYQLRIALRDSGSDRIGSASQFVDVPDVKKGRLALSGLVIEGSKRTTPEEADNVVEHEDPRATVALRAFRQGTSATYFCEVYNARRGKDNRPQLESTTRLYRDGVEVFNSAPRAVELAGDGKRTIAAGMLQFGPSMPPASYLFEVTVVDKLAKKNNRSTQTIDFEVIR